MDELKDILKNRNLDLDKCIRSTDEMMQQVAIEVFKGTHIDQVQVALISSVMNIADIYRSKKFSFMLSISFGFTPSGAGINWLPLFIINIFIMPPIYNPSPNPKIFLKILNIIFIF